MSEFVEQIRINKGRASYYEMSYPKRWKDEQPEKGCPLCNQGFEIGDPIFMVITHNTFPNTVIHQSCVDHDLILTTHALLKSYEKFVEFNKTHKGWKYEDVR